MQNKRVIYTNTDGSTSIIIPAPGATEEQCLMAVPDGRHYEIVDVDTIPSDRTFRNAWFHNTTDSPEKIGVHLDKAKDICHNKRRAKRAEEFAPLDVLATVPYEAVGAEAKRQDIRDRYAAIQSSIDSVSHVEDLKRIIEAVGLA